MRPDIQDDLTMMINPDLWPDPAILCVKRRTMIGLGDVQYYGEMLRGVRNTVYVGENCEPKTYGSLEELVTEWTVD